MGSGYGQNPGGYGDQPSYGAQPGNHQQVPQHPNQGGYGLPPPTGTYDNQMNNQMAPGGFGGQPGNSYNQQGAAPYNQPGSQPGTYSRMSSTNPMNLIWFAAACCVMLGAVLSFVNLLLSLEWVDALEMGYLFLFGWLLAVLDTPLFNQVAIVSELRTAIGKYMAVLLRVTGKGTTYIFLGCALASSMYANVEGSFMITLCVAIGAFVVFVGVFSLMIAVLKSRNLNLVRLELGKDPMSLKQMYDMHARMNPQAGITQEEFKKMAPTVRGVSFEQADIRLIFNALSSNPRHDVISLEDLSAWVNGKMMVFI